MADYVFLGRNFVFDPFNKLRNSCIISIPSATFSPACDSSQYKPTITPLDNQWPTAISLARISLAMIAGADKIIFDSISGP